MGWIFLAVFGGMVIGSLWEDGRSELLVTVGLIWACLLSGINLILETRRMRDSPGEVLSEALHQVSSDAGEEARVIHEFVASHDSGWTRARLMWRYWRSCMLFYSLWIAGAAILMIVSTSALRSMIK